jgi:hypothetical protein
MIKQDQIKEIFKVYKTSDQKYHRVGSLHDGGYVMADDFKDTDFVVSCGIGDDVGWSTAHIDFERQVVDTVAGLDMYECAIDSLNDMPKNSRFFKAEISKDVFVKDILTNAGPQEDYILKMDIEGAEWDFFLDSTSDDLAKFRQLVVEFHWLNNIVDSTEWYDKIVSVFSKIGNTHNLVILHGNNHSPTFEYEDLTIPDVIEVLFLRKDSYTFVNNEDPDSSGLPEELLTPCSTEFPEIYFVDNRP